MDPVTRSRSDPSRDPGAHSRALYGLVQLREAAQETLDDAVIAAGVSDRLWSLEDVAAIVVAAAPKLGKRGPYRVRLTSLGYGNKTVIDYQNWNWGKYPDAANIAIRICLSALIAYLSGYLFVVAPGYIINFQFSEIPEFLAVLLIFVSYFFVISFPITVLAVVTGIIFRRQIARQPAIWSLFAICLIWVFTVSTMIFVTPMNEWQRSHTFIEIMYQGLTGSDGMLVLLGASCAGLFFYLTEKFELLKINTAS